MKYTSVILALFGLPLIGWAEVRSPQPLRAQEIGLVPYRWNGMVVAQTEGERLFTGSGVVVQPNVYATAAHVIYDDSLHEWMAPNRVRFASGHHSNDYSERTGRPTASFVIWDSYATRKKADTSPSGTSSTDTFNADFAVGYMLDPVMSDASFAPAFVDEPETITFLRQKRTIMVTGYPTEPAYVAGANRGRMHATEIYPFDVFWEVSQTDTEEHWDSAGFWFASYFIASLRVGGGNSGGPVWAQDDTNRWLVNGVLVGGGDQHSLIRGLDRAAWMLVEQAQQMADPGRMMPRLERPTVSAGNRSVTLHWTHPEGSVAERYEIQRRGADGFEQVMTLRVSDLGEGPEFTFVDQSVLSGTAYTYQILPINGSGGRGPASPPVHIKSRGSNPEIGRGFTSPGLSFTTGGDAPAFQEWGLATTTGKIYSMERSYIELSLIGPGMVRFEWAVSSEENERYGDPLYAYGDYVYDAFYFYLNDEEQEWISGEVGPKVQVVPLGIGNHVLRWEYRKDPYTDEGQDAGFLLDVQWTPNNRNLYFFGATPVDEIYQYAHWFGYYTFNDFPWTYSYHHGWLFLTKVGNHDVWAFDPDPEIGWMYLSPFYFPYVFTSEKGWLYYYPDSGVGGQQRWFHVLSENRDFQTGP